MYRCDSGTCVDRDSICDGIFDRLCPEDSERQRGIGFKCIRNGKMCVLPQRLLLDDISDCDNGEDLCFHQDHDRLLKFNLSKLFSIHLF